MSITQGLPAVSRRLHVLTEKKAPTGPHVQWLSGLFVCSSDLWWVHHPGLTIILTFARHSWLLSLCVFHRSHKRTSHNPMGWTRCYFNCPFSHWTPTDIPLLTLHQTFFKVSCNINRLLPSSMWPEYLISLILRGQPLVIGRCRKWRKKIEGPCPGKYILKAFFQGII